MTIRHFTASAVVLDDTDRVLLVHHNKLGKWLYPGGHVDPNETPAEAAVREVLEETAVQAVVLGEPAFTHAAVDGHAAPWAVIEMDVTDSKVGAHRHIDFVYVCRASGGELAAQPEEVAGARWVPVGDVAALATPTELPELVAAAAQWAKTQR
ncbi:NUDIX domain-containing protein [Actinopolymorpha sp. B9G3]|uniref:NUDIX hydrolase n=1 Tax=Actinopolymorpha sp. B9G3 TaxID=3158970 RepID=UPI0032D983A7